MTAITIQELRWFSRAIRASRRWREASKTAEILFGRPLK